MQVSPQVTVVIPTYNAEKFLAQTIDSVLSQSCTDIEIIVVDDGSTDGTRDVAGRYGNRLRLIKQHNSGVCAARNRGLAEANAPLICFLDHDDYWVSDKIERQLAAFKSDPDLGVVFSSFLRWNERQDGSFDLPADVDIGDRSDGLDTDLSNWIYHRLLEDCHVLTSTAMIKVDALESVGAFDLALPYAEDWDLWLRLSRRYRFAKLKRTTTLYRQHIAQGSRTVRAIDYRTRLLAEAANRWGLASPDGTEIPRRDFERILSAYHLSYGFDRLKAGQKWPAVTSFRQGWLLQPFNLRIPIYALAGIAGWRPTW